MGSTNLETEQTTVLADVANPTVSPRAEKEAEPSYDTGVTAWLQVVGSFFLFFNSWYVGPLPKKEKKIC
jgi:hypothetical protein